MRLINFRLIDGTGRFCEQAALNVNDQGRIDQIWTGENAKISARNALDLDGQTLLPGLFDCHVHLMSDAGPDPFAAYQSKSGFYMTILGAMNAGKMLRRGITTIRDVGAMDFADAAIKLAINEGVIPGPRMLSSGKLLTMTGGHGWFIGQEIDGPDEARKYARLNLKMGADNIKMMASGGVMTPNVNPRSPSLTIEELKAGFEEAIKAGKLTSSHAQATEGIKNAIRAGVHTIEHGVWLDEEACQMMKDRGVYLDATLTAPYFILAHIQDGTMASYVVEKAKVVSRDHVESFKMAKTMGVKIICGTDAGTPFNIHGEMVTELEQMQKVGLTPMEAIVAATKTSAEAMRLDGITGTIEVGKLADMIVVNGDPLHDLSVLRRPTYVFKEGWSVPLDTEAFMSVPTKVTPAQITTALNQFVASGCACY
jgi:imidazolonepropionase-like amidohydrolase